MKNNQQPRNPIQKAILDARTRTGDDRIGVSVKQGRFNITLTSVDKGKWTTAYLKRDLSGPAMISELEGMK